MGGTAWVMVGGGPVAWALRQVCVTVEKAGKRGVPCLHVMIQGHKAADNSAVIHERALVSLIVLALGLPW